MTCTTCTNPLTLNEMHNGSFADFFSEQASDSFFPEDLGIQQAVFAHSCTHHSLSCFRLEHLIEVLHGKYKMVWFQNTQTFVTLFATASWHLQSSNRTMARYTRILTVGAMQGPKRDYIVVYTADQLHQPTFACLDIILNMAAQSRTIEKIQLRVKGPRPENQKLFVSQQSLQELLRKQQAVSIHNALLTRSQTELVLPIAMGGTTAIDLVDCTYDQRGVETAIVTQLNENTVQTLDISAWPRSGTILCSALQALGWNNSVQILDLGPLTLNEQAFRLLCAALGENQHLRQLTLQDFADTNDRRPIFLHVLWSHPTLRVLTFTECPFLVPPSKDIMIARARQCLPLVQANTVLESIEQRSTKYLMDEQVLDLEIRPFLIRNKYQRYLHQIVTGSLPLDALFPWILSAIHDRAHATFPALDLAYHLIVTMQASW